MGLCNSIKTAAEEDFKRPEFYRGRDGPKYRVMNFTAVYEYRQYQATTWISTNLFDTTHKKALQTGNGKIKKYFEGKNAPGKILPMTCPLRTQLHFNSETESTGNFVVSIHTPYECLQNPPAPMTSEIYVQDEGNFMAYVLSFEGYATEDDWRQAAADLRETLDKEGQEYNKELFYTYQYDGPYKFTKRHNEVILIGTQKRLLPKKKPKKAEPVDDDND